MKRNADLSCENNFIPDENISNNWEKLSKNLGVNSSEEINWNLSKNELYNWGEMFINLNSCPSFYTKLYWKAIYGPKSRIAMLGANIIKNAKIDFKFKAIQIFSKISSVLGFQHISYYSDENERFNENIADVEGENSYFKRLLDLFYVFPLTDKILLQTLSNHPVHILKNKFSTSSFIPFCSFGKKFIGERDNEFYIPVCNIFSSDSYCRIAHNSKEWTLYF